MTASGRLGRSLLAIFCLAPLAWLLCFAVFAAAVTVKVGHFPSYSNPDPKHVEGLGALYELTVILMLPVLLSPIVLGAGAGWALVKGHKPGVGPAMAGAYALGMALVAVIFVGDAFGLRNWLLD